MLNKIQLTNFKSHKNTELTLGNLTLLCGENGVGKSSIIQSLLLLRQTHQKNRLHQGLDLNKPLCEIGSGEDLFYEFGEGDDIGIALTFGQQAFFWNFHYNASNSNATFLKLLEASDHANIINDLPLFNQRFQYLSASRLSPQESYPKDDYEVEVNKQLSIEEGKGELVAHFLDHFAQLEVLEGVRHESAEFPDLKNQAIAWEREISKNVNVKVESYGSGYEIKYSFDLGNGFSTTDFSSKNVGFGLSYALPVIVALLATPKGGLVLIENPEAHLHPYGQSKLAELICRAAQAGVQVIVETHSDHMINGVAVASKLGQIEHDHIKIWSFDRDETEHAAVATEVKVLEGGRLDKRPAGFFDQMGKDLRILMRTITPKKNG